MIQQARVTAGLLLGLMIVALVDDSGAVDCPYSDESAVLFTPKIGLEISGGHLKRTDAMGRISAEVGYGQWWNFDGPDRATGWRALAFVTVNILR